MIGPRKIVKLDYTLRDGDGEILDTSEGGEPLSYLHGGGQIVAGLESALLGLDVGAEKEVVVAPEDGYGMPDPNGVFTVPRSAFPPDLSLTEGDAFMGENDDGSPVPVRVIEVRDDAVLVDANHPLAGVTLHFHVTVIEVRDATLEELTHGHSHEGNGHQH
ncbi:MAG: peptidylprolyl isomerase [Myxococcales bacterium]|nr:peptidylprolyl isomerase [Myxococcales bacterium]